MTTVLLAGVAGRGRLAGDAGRPSPARVGAAGTLRCPPPADERGPRRWLWSALAGLGAWAFVSGAAGLAVGVVAAGVVWVVLGRAETPAQRARRVRVRAELPHVVGLLAAAVRGGLPPADALALVCVALPGPAADSLATLPPRIALGVDPAEAWRVLETDPALAPLGRTLARSARTGEPIADALDRLGAELAARARADAEDAARRVGVRAAVPLGLCLLPAFLLIGIVPVVAGLVSRPGGLTAPRAHSWSTGGRPATAPPQVRRRTGRGRSPLRSTLGGVGTHRASPDRRHPMTISTRPDERGITTAEYAVGTAAGAGLAGLLYKLLSGGFGDQLLKTLFDHVLGLLGIK